MLDGFTLSQIDPLGGNTSQTREYSATGVTTTLTDPRGNTTTSISDITGRPVQQIDAAGNATSITYCNCCDQPASITDALGNTINYVYDIRGRKVAEYGTGIQPIPPPPLRGLWSQIAPPQFAYAYDEADRISSQNASSGNDTLQDFTVNSYSFKQVLWVLGGGTVKTVHDITYEWSCVNKNKDGSCLVDFSWDSKFNVHYSDIFKDITDAQELAGFSLPLGNDYSYSHFWDNEKMNNSGQATVSNCK